MAKSTKKRIPGIEPDLKDLCSHLLRRWRSILAAGLICAIVSAVGQYVLTVMVYEKSYSNEKYESITAEMSESEIEEINELYRRYRSYQQLLEDTLSPAEEIFLLLDPDDATVCRIEYVFQSDYEAIPASFAQYSLGEEEYQEIADIIGFSGNAAAASSLISFSGSGFDEAVVTVASDTDTSNIYLNNFADNESNDFYGQMNIEILAGNQEQCKEIADVVRSAVAVHQNDLQTAGVSIILTEVTAEYLNNAESEISVRIQTCLQESEEQSDLLENFDFAAACKSSYLSILSDDGAALFNFYLGCEQGADYSAVKSAVKGLAVGIFLYDDFIFSDLLDEQQCEVCS